MKASRTGLTVLASAIASCVSTNSAASVNPASVAALHRSPLFVVRPNARHGDAEDVLLQLVTRVRGGDLDDEDAYDSEDEVVVEEEEEEEEVSDEEEEEEEEVVTLSKSTVAAAKKSKKKATSKSKATVNASLKASKPIQVPSAPKKKRRPSRSIGEVLHIPYIVRACMNPLTVFAMTRAYFASLFNISYLDETDSSQGLRSALEAKAKREAAAGGGASKKKKGKRAMKPGQAKSLSDLPALSA